MDTILLWEIIGKSSSLVTLADFFYKQIRSTSHTIGINNKMEEIGNIIDYANIAQDMHSMAEKIEQYINNHERSSLGRISISDNERKDFIDSFFKNHTNLYPFKADIINSLNFYLDKWETIINKELSFSEKVLLNHEISNSILLKHIITVLNEIKDNDQGNGRKKYKYNDNLRYSNSFCDTLFLHKDKNDKVNLQNLFILPKYKVSDEGQFEIANKPLDELIRDFLTSEKKALFIEGDAGSGKTTLVAWLTYHYCVKDEFAKKVFGSRNLITIRLRDLDKELIQKHRLTAALLSYLGFSTITNMVNTYPNTIMVLDGYDELCLIEGIVDYENMLQDLFRRNLPGYQFIITVRPKYLDFSQISINKIRISLEHFKKSLREQWIEKYIKECEENIPDYLKEYILQDDQESYLICDTPMTLYMMVAKSVPLESLSNEWALYNSIFGQELSETEYNQMIPNPDWDYIHPIDKYRDILYQISEKIAYKMYESGNEQLFVSSSEIGSIVEGLLVQNVDNNICKTLSERCYGLCAYWKADARTGYVEFYHNNIRDFFLCEWIYRKINMLVHRYTDSYGLNWIDKRRSTLINSLVESLVSFFNNYLYSNVLDEKVCEFIYQRAKYVSENIETLFDAEKNKLEFKLPTIDFPLICLKQDVFKYTFNKMLTEGIVCPKKFGSNPIQSILTVYVCVAQVFRCSAESFLHVNLSTEQYETLMMMTDQASRDKILNQFDNQRYFEWWTDHHAVNKNGMLPYIFRQVFHRSIVIDANGKEIPYSCKSDFSYVDLKKCDLTDISFENCIIRGVVYNIEDTSSIIHTIQETAKNNSKQLTEVYQNIMRLKTQLEVLERKKHIKSKRKEAERIEKEIKAMKSQYQTMLTELFGHSC